MFKEFVLEEMKQEKEKQQMNRALDVMDFESKVKFMNSQI